jgi:hypothetical protein
MQKGYSNDPCSGLPRANANAAYYSQRAAIEREHAIRASNEVVADVHEKLACRYAAVATQLSSGTAAPHVAWRLIQ